ncbi:Altered inheritance of mitochondria protein 18 mitochondrial [Allomyces javanicus]|nr:Altered inheritance of mitochondria protein 18 mitochondrial [Allomyces javanicus]
MISALIRQPVAIGAPDPTTGITLPRTVTVAGKSFRLLGLGARQVTILNLNVYVLGIYVPATTALPSNLTDPEAILDGDVVLYLTPTRNTGAAHLRDGFVRTLLDASKAATTPEEREQYLDDINAFKTVFPKSNVTKGQVFLFHHAPKDQQITLMHDGQVQGTVASPWLGTALLRAYLREKKPISPKARASIVQGLADGATTAVPRA